MATTGAAVVGAGAALWSASESANSGRKADKRAKEAAEAAAAIAGKEAQLAEDQWNYYLDTYRVAEESIVEEAMAEPDYEGAAGRATADVAQSFDRSGDISRRNLTRRGIDPSSGTAIDVSRRTGTDRALAEVGARNISREQEDDKSWARRMAAVGLGKGIPGQAASLMSSAGAGYGRASDRASREATGYAGSAGRGVQAAGNFIQQGINSWDRSTGPDTMQTNQNQSLTTNQQWGNPGSGTYDVNY